MVYDLDGLEEYLLSLIKNYMEYGVIKSDSNLSFFEILFSDVEILASLNVDNTNQNQTSCHEAQSVGRQHPISWRREVRRDCFMAVRKLNSSSNLPGRSGSILASWI